jgi:hypothetical protein
MLKVIALMLAMVMPAMADDDDDYQRARVRDE